MSYSSTKNFSANLSRAPMVFSWLKYQGPVNNPRRMAEYAGALLRPGHLPRYPKLLGLADCVVNIAPSLIAKRHILCNAIGFCASWGYASPRSASCPRSQR